MTVALITGPSHEPVSLSEAKDQIRVDHSHEDILISNLITAARQHTELVCGQKFLTQSWRQYASCYPEGGRIISEISPAQSVAAVTIFDRDGNPSVLAADDYHLARGHDPAILEIASTAGGNASANGLEIDWIAGLADVAAELPTSLKRAVLMLVAHWYEFRGAVEVSNHPVSIPIGFEALVRPYQRVKL